MRGGAQLEQRLRGLKLQGLHFCGGSLIGAVVRTKGCCVILSKSVIEPP